MKSTAFCILLLLGLGIAIYPAASLSATPRSDDYQGKDRAKVEQMFKRLVTCFSYFGFALNARRRDPRLQSRNLFDAQKTLHSAIKTVVNNSGFSMEQFRSLKNDIEDVMYLRTDRETRKIGILVDDYDVSCQVIVDKLDRAKKIEKQNQ